MLQFSPSRWHFIGAFVFLGIITASFGLVIYSIVGNDTYEVVLPPTPDRASTVLDFWFGSHDGAVKIDSGRIKLWTKPDNTQQDLMRERFRHDIKLASDSEYSHWGLHPRGRLGLILLLDSIAEETLEPKEFYELNVDAVEFCLDGIRKNQDKDISLIERAFFYRPLLSTERLAMQNRGVALYESLLQQAPESFKAYYAHWLDMAKQKRDIIHKFGRFPHRNELLERESTDQEMRYLSGSDQ
jgi:uncharacterized protein (DUF924 family)